MHKNIWILLTAALSLNIAVFADTQEGQKGDETANKHTLFANEEEEQPKASLFVADEKKETPVESLVACGENEEEEEVKKSLLATDNSEEIRTNFIG